MASSSKHKLDAAVGGDDGVDPARDVAAYLHAVQDALVPLTRTAAALPASSDLDFHRSLNPALSAQLDAHSDRLVGLINGLASWVNPSAGPATVLPAASSPGALQAGVPRAIRDLVDSLLERADINLDEYTGRREPRAPAFSLATGKNKSGHQPAQPSETDQRGKGKAKETLKPLPSNILNAPIKKPQRLFTTKPDNRSNLPWVRPLRYGKPHAITPLDRSGPNRPGGPDPKQVWKKPKTRQGMFCSEGDPQDNYYYTEIINAELPAHVLEPRTPVRTQELDPEQPEAPTDAGPFTWVDTADGIRALAEHLTEDRVQEIAIDLEHTSYRSYMGLTCLMQISTRWGDWIVDTLADPVREHAELFNQAFADPKKIKVLHGADHDVLWMQRDLGLYIVGLFDTFQAAVILEYPMKGLAYLLERFCNFRADKRYQLADWRIRPLPKEMLYYAREDTHDLLYIYDCLLTELRTKSADSKDAVLAVFQRSKGTAARTYAKDVWDEEGLSREGWKSMVVRYGPVNETSNVARQHWLVRALHRWRDEVARKEDESPKYVLSSTMMLSLASQAPRSPQETLNLIQSGPRELKARLGELTKLIVQEIAAFERHAHDEAEALKLAAMGGQPATEAVSSQVMELSSDAVAPVEDGAGAEMEEVGEKVDRMRVETGDVDMFEESTEPSIPPPRTAEATSSSHSTSARTGAFDASTASSPQVASQSLWTKGAAVEAPVQAIAATSKTESKPKRSLFSFPPGFGGISLFGGGSTKKVMPTTTQDTEAGPSPASAIVATRHPQSKLFGGLDSNPLASTSVRSSTTSSADKVSVIRAGFAAAMDGLLKSGASPATTENATGPSSSGDYQASGTHAAVNGFSQQALSSSTPVPVVKTMSSGRALGAITQKLLSRGFHNAPAGDKAGSSSQDGGADEKPKPPVKSEHGPERDEDENERVSFGDIVRLKKVKPDKSARLSKKRSLEEAGSTSASTTTTSGSTSKADEHEAKKMRTGFLKPFDLAKEVSILDLPTPSSSSSGGPSGSKSRKKDGGGKQRRGEGGGGGRGEGGTSFGFAPRKRNEMGSGNKSATFG